jgi:hypothetical protein
MVKYHVDQLKNKEILNDFVLELNCNAGDAKKVIILISTNQTEDRDFFSDHIGNNQLIESVTLLNDGRYLVRATCYTLDDLSRIDRFFRELSNIKSVMIDTLGEQSPKRLSLTRMQLEILKLLFVNPRSPSSEIAAKINRSQKGVWLAIKRLVDSGSILFTTQCKFATYYAMLQYEKTSLALGRIIEWVNEELNYVWEVLVSSIEPTLYIIFAVDEITEINFIHRKIRTNPFLSLQDAAICEPTRFYGNKNKQMLYHLIENGNLPNT